jgi:oligopeptide/dipeptide ABC transporter ATP-binding protein
VRRQVLKGDVPSPIDPPKGCAFHPRCPHVMEECRSYTPQLKPIAEEQNVSCFLYK